jgi:subtilisin family serine protease
MKPMSNTKMNKPTVRTAVLVACVLVAVATVAAWPRLFARGGQSAATAGAVSAASNSARDAAGPGVIDLTGLAATPTVVPKAGVPQARGTFIVTFREPALAAYRGGVPGIAVPKRGRSPGGRERLDVKSAEAQAYVGHLRRQQSQWERQIARTIGAPLPVRMRMQHGLNAIVVDMSNAQAARVARLPEVLRVDPERLLPLNGDAGTALIGAGPVWNGTNPGAPAAYQGEGMVVGIVDSGINFGSPSFAATAPADGYVHVNPLGAGTFLGTCASGGVDAGRCNAKLIGGYDFVCGAPANQCGQPNIREEPGFGDTNGHGTHVASIAAGNRRDVTFLNAPLRIAGVAPRANIVAFDACYTNTSDGRGLCPSSSTSGAINQAIADGIVDAINYSIGGGTEPWNDPSSLAMLNAVAAGIYVATSAGNSGPNANTLSHLEPWVSSTAAAQHGRGAFGILMSVTGPAPVPAAIAALPISIASGGTEPTATIPPTTPLRISPGINSANDGCSAFPANSFAGAIAVVRRGTCNLNTKVNNATTAGAIVVLIANNAPGTQSLLVGGASIPVFGVTQAEGDALRNFGNANPSATAQISWPATGLPNVADALGSFSSRGPAANFDLIKPDITAPGVDVLAAYAGTALTGSEQAVDTLSGTSMASPHVTGAVLLVRQARPSWTPPEVKSALMMTATTQVYLEDQITLAGPLARGSGRVRVDRAINAGLVLNETSANFQAANPGSGGNPGALNLPSLADATCAGSCSFTRTFRNARTYGSLWRVQLVGLNGTVQSLLWVPMGGTASLPVTINTTGLPANGSWNFGSLVLTELFTGAQTSTSSELRLPIGVVVPAGGASLSPTAATPGTESLGRAR